MKEEVLRLKLNEIGLPEGLFMNLRHRLFHCKIVDSRTVPTVQNLIDAGLLNIIYTQYFGPASMRTLLKKMQDLGVSLTVSSTEFENWAPWAKNHFGKILEEFNAIVKPSEQLEMVSLDTLHQTLPQQMKIEEFNIAILTKYGMVALKALPAQCFEPNSKTMEKIERLKLQYIQNLAQGLAEVKPKNFPNTPERVLEKTLQERCDKMFDEQCAYEAIVSQKREELSKPEKVEAPKPTTKTDGKNF